MPVWLLPFWESEEGNSLQVLLKRDKEIAFGFQDFAAHLYHCQPSCMLFGLSPPLEQYISEVSSVISMLTPSGKDYIWLMAPFYNNLSIVPPPYTKKVPFQVPNMSQLIFGPSHILLKQRRKNITYFSYLWCVITFYNFQFNTFFQIWTRDSQVTKTIVLLLHQGSSLIIHYIYLKKINLCLRKLYMNLTQTKVFFKYLFLSKFLNSKHKS